MLPDMRSSLEFVSYLLENMLSPQAAESVRSWGANRGWNLNTGYLAELNTREKEILSAFQRVSEMSQRREDAVSGRGPARPTTEDVYNSLERERRQGQLRMQEADVNDIDPAFLRVENFTRYLLDDVLLSQLDDQDKNTVFSLFEEMHLKDALGDDYGGMVYRAGSGSTLSENTNALLLTDKSRMAFSSPDSLRLPYNLFMKTRRTAQMYILTTFVPQEYFLRPEVKMAAMSPLDSGEFYRIFQHIMMTIAKEKIYESLVTMRGSLARLEHFCRVHSSRMGTPLTFSGIEKDRLKQKILSISVKQANDVVRRQSAKLLEKLNENRKKSARESGLYQSARRTLNSFFSPIGAGTEQSWWESFQSGPLGIAAGEVLQASWKMAAIPFLASGLGKLYNSFKGNSTDAAVLALQLANTDLGLGRVENKKERVFDNSLEPLNAYNKLLLLKRKVDLVTYSATFLSRKAEQKLVELKILPNYRY